jgi:peptide/nickel transport system substrate-binding protein
LHNFKEDAVFSKKVFSGLIVSAAVVLALVGCSSGGASGNHSANTTATSKTLTIGTLQDVPTFDPAQTNIGDLMQYMYPSYDSLIRQNNTGQYVPMLATSWKYTNSAHTDFEFTIRSGVKFSDGTAMTAETVAASLKRFQAANGPEASAFQFVKSIAAVGKSTIRLTLSAPDPSLVYNLTLTPGMITNPKASSAALKSVPAGTGPYVLDTATSARGNVYKFTRNKYYWDAAAFPFKEVDLKVLTDPTARLNAVISGQADATYGISSQVTQAKASNVTVLSWLGGWYGLFLQDRDGVKTPALSNVLVRQAINYAIDKKALLKAVAFGQGSLTTQIFGPATPAYQKSLDNAYPFDPAKAKALLAKAGYANGFTINMPELDIQAPASYPIIKQELGNVGINVTYTTITAAGGVAPFVNGSFSSYVFVWGSSNNWVDANELLSAKGVFNPFHVNDPKIASFMTSISLATGAKQDALFKALDAYVVKQAWFDPWYISENYMLVGSHVTVTAQPGSIMPPLINYAPAK